MTIDATFWVAISFFIFFGVLIYLKVPQKINNSLNDQIKEIINTEIDIIFCNASEAIAFTEEEDIHTAELNLQRIFAEKLWEYGSMVMNILSLAG